MSTEREFAFTAKGCTEYCDNLDLLKNHFKEPLPNYVIQKAETNGFDKAWLGISYMLRPASDVFFFITLKDGKVAVALDLVNVCLPGFAIGQVWSGKWDEKEFYTNIKLQQLVLTNGFQEARNWYDILIPEGLPSSNDKVVKVGTGFYPHWRTSNTSRSYEAFFMTFSNFY